MQEKTHNKNKKSQLYITSIRIIAAILIAYLLYHYMYADFRPKELWIQIQNLSSTSSLILLAIGILLMPINWLFESQKWKTIISLEFPMQLGQAFKSVFRGISLGIITPGRVGEYGGRIVDLPAEVRKYGILSTFICSLSQNFVNVFVGLIAMLLVGRGKYYNENQSLTTLITTVVALLAIVILYFNVQKVIRFFLRYSWFSSRIGGQIIDFAHQDKINVHWTLLGLSALRYATYSLQYLVIALAFSVDISLGLLLGGIAVIFVIQTIIPLSPLLQFTLRGSLAVYILGSLGADENAAVLCSYSIWFINLLIPAFIGAVWLLITKVKDVR